MKRYISLLLIISLLCSLCATVSAAEGAEIAISDITPPVSGEHIYFTQTEPRDYSIVSQAWVEYQGETLSRACISGSDSFYADAYAAVPLLESFEEGLFYQYVLVLTNKERMPFTSAPSLRLCGQAVSGNVSVDEPMYCIYETSFVCQVPDADTPIQITLEAPVVGSLPDSNAKISEDYTITELKWFDGNGKVLNGSFLTETDYTLRVRFQKTDTSAFTSRPNVSINGQEPTSLVMTHAKLCTVQFRFPYTLHIEDLILPTAGAQPKFCTNTQYDSYCISYQEWQELSPGGFLARRCTADGNGQPVSVGSAELLTEFIPGFTYSLHLTFSRSDGSKITQSIPCTVAGRSPRSTVSNGTMSTQTVFTLPFEFTVAEPFAGETPSFSPFSSEYYEVAEAWMELNENGETVNYITNDEATNADIHPLHRLTKFESGKKYLYAVDITTKQGYSLTFVPEAYVNGLELHAGLYNDAVTLGYQRSFECTNVDKAVQFSHSLSLENDISINFISKLEQLADYDSYYLECTLPIYEGNIKTGEKRITVEPVEENGRCYFRVDSISAKQMNDEISAVIHMTKNGIAYTSRTDTYSIAEYAYNMLNKNGTSDALRTLCADLLRYGSQAQRYFSYRTDSLADCDMTQAQASYLTELDSVPLENHMQMLNDMEAPTLKWKSASLVLGNRISLQFIANLSTYEDSLSNLSARISYEDANGAVKTVILSHFVPIEGSDSLYSIECDFLAAKDLRCVLTASLYEGETQCSRSVRYSVESYASRQQNELLTLCRAIMAYSDSARSFFTNT